LATFIPATINERTQNDERNAMLIEINIDGLVGPTHHFGGLGVGNLASQEHHQQVSHPRQAAIEGLRKAQWIDSMGIPQFVFPPPLRPRWQFLRQLGIGNDQFEISQQAMELAKVEFPRGLSAAFSSAFMWMANAATITPACDSSDNRLHCTPANLISSWHRASEAIERTAQLRSLMAFFQDAVELHDPLPSIVPLRDEGAANHMRMCDRSGRLGINLFVYGASENGAIAPQKHFPRHTQEASQAIARLHQLSQQNVFFLQQHPQAIDAGVFHNDVISTSCGNLLLHHELAFLNEEDRTAVS
jgi:succinylarginine dihydrolase